MYTPGCMDQNLFLDHLIFNQINGLNNALRSTKILKSNQQTHTALSGFINDSLTPAMLPET